MAMRRCLGRVIGGLVYNQLKSISELNTYYAAFAKHGYRNIDNYSSFYFSRQIHSSENPKSIYNKVSEDVKGGPHSDPLILTKNYTKKEEPEDDELIGIKKGEIVNLSDLLFTGSRDYLIKCSDGQQVKAEELAGKVVVIYFDSVLDMDTYFFETLMHIYNNLRHNSGFEVVFVNFDDAVDCFSGEISLAPSQGGTQKHFEDVISRMPWTAIPLSDKTSSKRLKRRFGLPEKLYIGTPIVVDSTGMILQSEVYVTFLRYEAQGYPFSDERIDFLDSEDDAAARQPSLKNLLTSPERDYLISNKGDKVPIHTLEDMVVAFYFYNDHHSTNEEFTLQLKGVYEELAKNHKKFEVVLIYLYDTPDIQTEESFWKLFKSMPWLALPIGDTNYKKLERIFMFPWLNDFNGSDTRLIVFGPYMEFMEPFGSEILSCFKIPAYPFSREKVAMLAAEEAKELKLEMLWNPESVFGGEYGSEVSFSQLAGKRVIIFFDKGELYKWEVEFLETLKDQYIRMKGTSGEFEVIHITALSSKTEHVANLPWFVQLRGRDDNLFRLFDFYVSLIAFDRNGRLVRKAVYPTFEETDFPFYAGGLEKEALSQASNLFGWNRFHDGHPGTIYSYAKN